MPPKKNDNKRKASSSHNGRPNKKSKIEPKDKGSKAQCIGRVEVGKGSGNYRQCSRTKYNGGKQYACCPSHTTNPYENASDSEDVLEPKEVSESSEIQWIVPQGRTSYSRIYDRYATSLFGHGTHTNTFETTRFPPSPIQSPASSSRSAHTQTQIKAQSAKAHNLNESSAALRNASDAIINHLDGGRDDSNENEDRGNFFQAMDGLGENEAMLMAFDEMFGVDWQQVPLRGQNQPHVMLQEHHHLLNHIRILRCKDHSGQTHGFFLQIQPSEEVIVNGHVFRNLVVDSGDQYMYIGPLEFFTVIEYFGVPVFFWRKNRDLNYRPSQKQKALAAEQRSLRRRISRKQAALDRGRIIVTVHHEDHHEAPRALDENLAPEGDSPVQEVASARLAAEAHGTKSRSAEEVNKEKQRSQEDNSINSPKEPRDYCQELEEFFQKYRVIIDQYHVYPMLSEDPTGFLGKLIAHVQLAINDLSPDAPVFSIIDWDTDRVLCPARTLMIPVTEEGHTILVIAQLEFANKFSLHIFNSAYWHFDGVGRDRIRDVCYDRCKALGWIPVQEAKSSAESEYEQPQWSYHWVNCAQHTNLEMRIIYVVLNAWALALGLDINPDFYPRDIFHAQALDLFNLVFHHHSKGLDHKVLSSFLFCHGFVKNDQRVHTWRQFRSNLPIVSLRRQRRAAEAKGSKDLAIGGGTKSKFPKTAHADNRINETLLEVPSGMPHGGNFRFDNSCDHIRYVVVPGLIQAGRLQTGTLNSMDEIIDDQYLQTLYETQDALPSSTFTSPKTPTPAKPATPGGPTTPEMPAMPRTPTSPREPATPDTVQLFGGLSAYEYLTEEIQKLKERDDVSTWFKQWNLEVSAENYSRADGVFDGFASVLQAVSSTRPVDSGFAIIRREALEYYSSDGESGFISHVLFPRRILVFPWTVRHHSILIVVQCGKATSENVADRSISIHAIDSGPWRLTKADREIVFERVKDLIQGMRWYSLDPPVSDDEDGLFDDDNEVPFPPHIIWTTGPTQSEDHESEIFTLLTSWSIFLGLELNPNFNPEESFFGYVTEILSLTLGGYVDWKLMTAFLLCHDFANANPTMTPTAQFRQSIHRDNLGQSLSRLTAQNSQFWESFTGDVGLENNYEMPNGRPHTQTLRWDDWDQAYIQRISTLHDQYGRFNPKISEAELKRRCRKLRSTAGLSNSKLDNSKEPCKTLSRLLQKHDMNEDYQAWINEVKVEIDADYTKWLRLEDCLLSIASVTMAISSVQTPEAGFGILNSRDISICELGRTGDELQLDPVVRAGSPMIVPFIYCQHIVLFVLNGNEKNHLSITVFDSKQSEYAKMDRDFVHDAAWAMAKYSNWWKGMNDLKKPDSATWSTCSQQREDWLCGYYAILNAWAIGLGLDINPDFEPDLNLKENSKFYKQLQLIINLSRAGLAGWRTIVAFLECYKFVKSGQSVHPSRRFTNTIRFIDEQDLNEHLETLRFGEDRFFNDGHLVGSPEEDNQVRTPKGRQHDEDFASDGWSEVTRFQVIPDMQEQGWFRHNQDFLLTEAQITKRYRAMLKSMNLLSSSPESTKPPPSGSSIPKTPEHFFKGIEAHYKKTNQEFSSLGHDKMVQFLHFALDHRTSTFPGGAQSLSEIDKDPCTYYNGRSTILQRFKNVYSNYLTNSHKLPRLGELLFDEDVTFGVASVIEAIDSHQQQFHRGDPKAEESPFGGGLAIAEAGHLSFARSMPEYGGYRVMRPRRCWFMPFVIAGEFMAAVNRHRAEQLGQKEKEAEIDEKSKSEVEIGHMFLVVVQQERFEWAADDISEEFRVYIIDSAADYYNDVQPWLYEQIQNTARSMHWTSHRNPSSSVDFAKYHWTIDVPRQYGKWTCGLHLILNSWILALGLRPNEDLNFKRHNYIYKELNLLIALAIDGILDWKTLVSWLLCHDLVEENTMDAVPANRRFAHTQVQTDGNDLVVRIDNEVNQPTGNDYRLGAVAEAVVPYDFGNNVDFTNMTRTVMTTGILENFRLEKGRKKSSKRDWLYRGCSDFDDDFGLVTRRLVRILI